jgi:hypothetical protein
MNYVQEIREAIVDEITRTCPDWDIAETPDLLDSYALLVLSVGENVTRELVHDAWSLWSNRIGPTHRYLVPFADLTPAVQAQDEIGRAAIAAVARGRRDGEEFVVHAEDDDEKSEGGDEGDVLVLERKISHDLDMRSIEASLDTIRAHVAQLSADDDEEDEDTYSYGDDDEDDRTDGLTLTR